MYEKFKDTLKGKYLPMNAPSYFHREYTELYVIPFVKDGLKQDMSQKELCEYLNKNDIRTSTGNTWRQPWMSALLADWGFETVYSIAMRRNKERKLQRNNNKRSK